jgi:hypothetical protein
VTQRTLTAALYASLAVIVLLPVFLVQVPALGDAINHIARMAVLAAPAGSPLHRFYDVRWPLSPYLAMDAVVPLLAQFMPVMIAARVFIGACLLMPVAAVAVLHRAACGRVRLVPVAAFLLSQNLLLAFGFLNFLFMSGLAVMLFAAWIVTPHWPRWRRAAVFAPAVVVLYLGHIFACVGYCLAVAGAEVARAVRCRFRPPQRVALDWLAAAAQALPALLLVPFFDRGQVAVGEAVTQFGNLDVRLTALASPVLFLSDPVDSLAVLLTAAGLVVVAARLRIDAKIWPAALVLCAGALAMPHVLAGVWGTDLRLPIIACMVALGGVSARLPLRTGRLVLAAITALVLAKSIDGTVALQRLDARIAVTRRVLDAMPPGSRLLVMDEPGLQAPGVSPNVFWHIPLMAVIDRAAFVPYLFTGFMTVHPRPGVQDASTPSGRPLDLAELKDGLTHDAQPGAWAPDGRGGRIYWYGWPKKFDFLLVQHAGQHNAPPGPVQLVAASEVADLYRIIQVDAEAARRPPPQPSPTGGEGEPKPGPSPSSNH